MRSYILCTLKYPQYIARRWVRRTSLVPPIDRRLREVLGGADGAGAGGAGDTGACDKDGVAVVVVVVVFGEGAAATAPPTTAATKGAGAGGSVVDEPGVGCPDCAGAGGAAGGGEGGVGCGAATDSVVLFDAVVVFVAARRTAGVIGVTTGSALPDAPEATTGTLTLATGAEAAGAEAVVVVPI